MSEEPPTGRPAGEQLRREILLGKLHLLLAKAPVAGLEALHGMAVRLLSERGQSRSRAPRLRHALRPEGEPAAAGEADYLIRQESVRRRAGKQDRTLAVTRYIQFGRNGLLLPPWVGSDIVVCLIGRQGKELDASELTEAVRKSLPSDGDTHGAAQAILYGQEEDGQAGQQAGGRIGEADPEDMIWDEHQIEACRRRILWLQDEMAMHEEARDLSSRKYQDLKRMLEEQQDLLGANARLEKGVWVPKAYRAGTFQEKAELIRKHVRKLLDEHLRDNCRPLFDHLNDRNTLIYGVRNCYHPTPPVPWRFEPKPG